MSMSVDKTLHIVQIIPTLRHGGAERLVVDLSNGLVDQGHRVTIITFFDDVPLANELHASIEHVVVQKRGKISFGLVPALAKAVKDVQPDIVHTHLFGADVWGRFAVQKLGIPIVTTEHNINHAEGLIKHAIKKRFSHMSPTHVAVSEEVAVYMGRSYGIHKDDIKVIHPGISTSIFSSIPNAPITMPHVLMLGRLEKQKGFDIGLKALAKVKDHTWTAEIVGSGSEAQSLESLITKLELTGRVSLSPATDDVTGVYKRANIVLMPSRWEGFGMVGMEAMASGRLLIASRVGGLQDVVEDNKTGLLVEPESVDGLVDALNWTFDHVGEVEEIAEQGRSAARAFDITRMVDSYVDIYHTLV